jgi:hypothetical protein
MKRKLLVASTVAVTLAATATEISAQVPGRGEGWRGGPGAGSRGPGPGVGYRGPGPGVGYRGQGPGVGYRGPGPGVGPGVGYRGPGWGYRGPGWAYRGPRWGYRGPGWGPGVAAGVVGGALIAGAIIASRPPGYVVYQAMRNQFTPPAVTGHLSQSWTLQGRLSATPASRCRFVPAMLKLPRPPTLSLRRPLNYR